MLNELDKHEPMNIHIVLHDTFEGPGCIENWAEDKGHRVAYTKMYDSNDQLPQVHEFDFLIIMGGSMSVHDQDTYGWLSSEKEFIKQAVTENKKILGVCLGAQLLASALGAKVYPAKAKEIGWFPIQFTSVARESSFFPDIEHFTVFHWHGDTFDLPSGTIRVGSSVSTPNQGFMLGNKVIGLQFHFEVTPSSIENLIKHAAAEITDGVFVQSPIEMRQGYLNHIGPNNVAMFHLLNKLMHA
jgi:GMP synthase (glutamine-hydrolysing)